MSPQEEFQSARDSDVIEYGKLEKQMVYRGRIEIDPNICSGKPVIRGTRILVTSLLSQLAAGESFEAIRLIPAKIWFY